MLTEFRVRNYRNFRDELALSLQTEKNYEFNNHVIKDGIVKDSIILGYNGSGKTNLGRAILDITGNLTDKNSVDSSYYTNLYTNDESAYFKYSFQLVGHEVEYMYEKNNRQQIKRECLTIDKKKVLSNDENGPFVYLKGAETLNLNMWENQISFVKYVYANTNLDPKDENNKAFLEFMKFVKNMLMFQSTEIHKYIGFKNVHGDVFKLICEQEDGVTQLERFLNEVGIHYKLFAKDDAGGGQNIYCKMGQKDALLSKIVSSGTRALVFFFYWYLQRRDISFVYIDEFDAFYHTDLSIGIIKKLIESSSLQAMLSTHNTDVISNELLRPDCYYLLEENKISPLNKRTSKALRAAHNLQKMYKAGAFNE